MKLADVLLLSLAVVCLVIGIHQTIMVGFAHAYWMIMLFVALFFLYSYRKRK